MDNNENEFVPAVPQEELEEDEFEEDELEVDMEDEVEEFDEFNAQAGAEERKEEEEEGRGEEKQGIVEEVEEVVEEVTRVPESSTTALVQRGESVGRTGIIIKVSLYILF